jgi:hypothetical protein
LQFDRVYTIQKNDAPSTYTVLNTNSTPVTSLANRKKVKENIKDVIFNDKQTLTNPIRTTDFMQNYTKPEKEDYRRKRCQTYYPQNEQTMNRETKSEYSHIYNKLNN